MSLQLNFEVCSTADCQYILFKDTTGSYSMSNPTGWGTPNEDIANAYKAELIIGDPSGFTHTIDITNGNSGSTGDEFPNVDPNIYYQISSATLSVTPPTTTIPISDGLYNFTYKVYIHGKDVDYYITKSKIILISCGVECATKKLMAGLSVCDCKCWDDKTYETAILAWTMLQSLLAARNCGTNQNTINKILTNLQNLLAISKSKCGCLDGSKGLNASAL
jgi:hypothetical protein